LDVHVQQEVIPWWLFQHKSQGALSECPGLSQETIRWLTLDLFANACYEGTNPLLKDVKIGLADESRVPDVDYTVDRLVDVVDHEGNKKHNSIARHDIQINVIHRNFDRLAVAARELANSLGHISKVTGSYSVIISSVWVLDGIKSNRARTCKQEAQRLSIISTFVRSELNDIKGGDVAPEVFLPSKLYPPRLLSDKGRRSVLQNPVGIPCFFAQRRLAIWFVKGPVGLLAGRAAVLEGLSLRNPCMLCKREWNCAGIAWPTTTRKQFLQVYPPTFLQSVLSGFQFAQMNCGAAILLYGYYDGQVLRQDSNDFAHPAQTIAAQYESPQQWQQVWQMGEK
jgi:hypothetical protein